MEYRIQSILDSETTRQENTIELIASENFASKDVMELCGSIFTNKYAEGYPGRRYYNGCEYMDAIENLAINELKKLYGCKFANVQPHCGANANTAIYSAFLKPGDIILGMDLASGGHLSHGAKVNISGKIYKSHSYGVDKNGLLNYNDIACQAHDLATNKDKSQKMMIVAGASAYSRHIDFKKFREISDQIGVYLLIDMAHYSGLIAGGAYPSPIPYADFVTSTTHKTLRGPRGGIVLWNDESYTKKINSSIFPGTQGGPLMNIIAAKAQAFVEANTKEFKEYTHNIIKNAQAMADVFNKNGFKLLTGGTDSHILLIDLSNSKYSGREAADLLEENGITVNKNGIPNDPRSFTETSGIRIGTAAETTRGRDVKWFKELAERIVMILSK